MKNKKLGEIDFDKIIDESIEEIFADRFSRYSKYIIQDRALPDARDGLKPVQRRILFSMSVEGNTYDNAYRKSAKTVGNVIGNYHPHGDTSVYDAMIRMSQPWKANVPLVIVHGNNGSVDGDNAAAMRYTEAKLAEIASEMVHDIDKKTVKMTPNFDDTVLEPTVMPTRYPNLLVNGASGISSGYATNIPPHNLSEVIKAALLVLENPEATVREIMKVIPGPDFPTGGIIQGKEGVKKAFETGRGKIVIKSKIKVEKTKKETKLIITELPYDVNKANLVRKIDEIIYEKKIEGIEEIYDETDYNGLQITIVLKKDANDEAILMYLLKSTDLQINFNYNMIAIKDRRPELLGIKGLIDAFINHRIDVVTKRSEFDLDLNQKRLHVAQGLQKAMSVLDEIIRLIRKSDSKANAKENIIKKFEFSEVQAEAIVMMQLYRLSNTDVTKLLTTISNLESEIKKLTAILANEDAKKSEIKDELEVILAKYKAPRRSKIEVKVDDIQINKEDLIRDEDVMITISNLGYIKKSPLKSFKASDNKIKFLNNDFYVKNLITNNKRQLMLFFDDGTYIYLPVYELKEGKWKDLGYHISEIGKINDGVKIVNAYLFDEFDKDTIICGVSKNGYVTYTQMIEFISKNPKKRSLFQRVKDDDRIASINIVAKNTSASLYIVTNDGHFIKPNKKNLETTLKRIGTKRINLKNKDFVSSSVFCDKETLMVLTNSGTYARISTKQIQHFRTLTPMKLFKNDSRAGRFVVNAMNLDEESKILVYTENNIEVVDANIFKINKIGENLERYKKGVQINYAHLLEE